MASDDAKQFDTYPIGMSATLSEPFLVPSFADTIAATSGFAQRLSKRYQENPSVLYADTKTLISAGLGALFIPAPETVIEADFQSQPEDPAQPKAKPKPALQIRRKTAR